jgi:hypothetical protein
MSDKIMKENDSIYIIQKTNRKLIVKEKWEQQKEYIKTKLSEEEMAKIYHQRKLTWSQFLDF